jgi:hypothetical protein
MNWYFVGVDFGQSRDFTAIAVLERAEVTGEWDPAMYAWRKEVSLRLRYLQRVALGTPYPEVVDRVIQVTRSPELYGRCSLTVDATGVGRAVVDLLRKEDPGCALLPVNITGGLKQTEEGGYHGVPKRDLILGLQVLLQRGLLQIAAGLEFGPELVKEMSAMQVKITLTGQEQYGAWREGTHDDLVFAVALAYWNAQKMYPKDPAGGEQWWTTKRQADAARVFKKVFKG